MSRKIKNRFFISLCFIQNDKVFLYLLNERYKFTKNILLKSQIYVSLCATLLGVFILQEQESYQNTLAFILFLTFWNGYFFTVYHRRKFAKIWNILGFVLISSILLKYFDLNFYLKWLIVLILGFIYNADF